MSYDSRQDTYDHIREVQGNLLDVVLNLRLRSTMHDASKLQDPEKMLFDEWTPKLKELTYGSDEYKTALASMGPALAHHYEVNSHHPEHYPNGIAGMSLFDVIEMLCDWCAAAKRHADGDLTKSLEINRKRFGIDNQLSTILENTRKELGW